MAVNYGNHIITTDAHISSKKRVETVSSVTITTAQIDNWDLSAASVFFVTLDFAGTYLSVGGILAGEEGEIKTIIKTAGDQGINFYHESSTSDSENRFNFFPSVSQWGDMGYQLEFKKNTVSFIYSSGKWRNYGGGQMLSPQLSMGAVGGGGV